VKNGQPPSRGARILSERTFAGGMQDWPLRVTAILDHAARFHGSREIVTRTVEGPLHRSDYRSLATRARQCAASLERIGATAGDRIATFAWNTQRHLELWYAAAGIGAIYHTVNPRLFEDQISYIVNDADDRLIFTDLTFVPLLERLRDRLGNRRIVVLTDREHMPDSDLDLACYEELIEVGEPDYPWSSGPETQPVGLCYTSGTTGAPKGVVYTHRSSVLHALAIHGRDGMGLRSLSCVMPVVPMYHANAWSLAFSAPLTGAKLVMPGPKLDGASLCDLMESEAVTLTAGVPTVWIDVIEQLRHRRRALPALERILIGGSACPRWILEAFEQEFGVEVLHAWGMTEMSPVGSFASLRAGMEKLDPETRMKEKLKQGAPYFCVEMRVIDEERREVVRDGLTAGSLQVKGPCVVAEYLHGAGGDILSEDGFFDTGDRATIDEFGFMQVIDRNKDIIKSGGEWISSLELENHAACHPEILEAAAIGLPDDKWGERPLLVAVRVSGSAISQTQLLDFLRPKMPRWWLPDAVEFIDAMPHTAAGKINKVVLRGRFKAFQTVEQRTNGRAGFHQAKGGTSNEQS
jgi:acyl-CoA synthetase (AMP-forming)/AMP-acid ligase II